MFFKVKNSFLQKLKIQIDDFLVHDQYGVLDTV